MPTVGIALAGHAAMARLSPPAPTAIRVISAMNLDRILSWTFLGADITQWLIALLVAALAYLALRFTMHVVLAHLKFVAERSVNTIDDDPRWPPQTAPLMATQTAPGRTGQLCRV